MRRTSDAVSRDEIFYTPPLFKPGFNPGMGGTHGGPIDRPRPLDDLGLGRDVFSVFPKRNLEPMQVYDFPDFQFHSHKHGGTIDTGTSKVKLDDYQNQIANSIAETLGVPKHDRWAKKKDFDPNY